MTFREKVREYYPDLGEFEKVIFDRYQTDGDDYKRDMYEIVMAYYNNKEVDLEKLGWKNDAFIEFHHDEKEEEFLEAVEGILKCMGCGSRKVQSFNKQTRGGDEGTTVFARCTQCGRGWREAG